MVRGALVALLSLEDDIELVAELGRGDEVVPRALDLRPDVALLDIEMPGLDGISAAAQLRQALPGVRRPDPHHVRSAGLPAPRDGCRRCRLPPQGRPRERAGVRYPQAAAGGRVVDPDLAIAALSEGSNPLSEREREVLAASVEAATIADIARALSLSEGTVRNHLSAAIQKVGARNRGEAARVALDRGWIGPGAEG